MLLCKRASKNSRIFCISKSAGVPNQYRLGLDGILEQPVNGSSQGPRVSGPPFRFASLELSVR